MSDYPITRAHLKIACQKRLWDLLDKFLEMDNRDVDDNSMFTDDWGLWWSMLCEVVRRDQIRGVRVLLKHGANPKQPSWGDGITETPIEMAKERPELLALLLDAGNVSYERKTEPELPEWPEAQAEVEAMQRQGEIRDRTGLVFPLDRMKDDG